MSLIIQKEMARVSPQRKRKLSAWNLAVRKAWKNGAASLPEAVKIAKMSYKSKSSPKRSSPKRSSPKRSSVKRSSVKRSSVKCPKGHHPRVRGKGSRCVKN